MPLIYTLPRHKAEKVRIFIPGTDEEIVIQIYNVVTETRSTKRMSIDAPPKYKIEKVRDSE